MIADTSTAAGPLCRACGSAAAATDHFCAGCATILPLGRPVDYFAFLGVPRKLLLDARELDARFRALSRQFHPDYFCNRPALERRASLERASYLNDAYRTLRAPASRLDYLLRLVGPADSGRHTAGHRTSVPAALLEDVFALNEELDEVRGQREAGEDPAVWRARLAAATRPIEARRDQHDAELQKLASRWDALVDSGVHPDDPRAREVTTALSALSLERNYIDNLIDTIAREQHDAPARG